MDKQTQERITNLETENKELQRSLDVWNRATKLTDLKAENENYFKTINRLKTAIGDAIVQMDEEPAKELLKQALKE